MTDIITCIKQHKKIGTKELAEKCGLTIGTLYRRLQQLRDDGEIIGQQEKTGFFWSPVEKLKPALTGFPKTRHPRKILSLFNPVEI